MVLLHMCCVVFLFFSPFRSESWIKSQVFLLFTLINETSWILVEDSCNYSENIANLMAILFEDSLGVR